MMYATNYYYDVSSTASSNDEIRSRLIRSLGIRGGACSHHQDAATKNQQYYHQNQQQQRRRLQSNNNLTGTVEEVPLKNHCNCESNYRQKRSSRRKTTTTGTRATTKYPSLPLPSSSSSLPLSSSQVHRRTLLLQHQQKQQKNTTTNMSSSNNSSNSNRRGRRRSIQFNTTVRSMSIPSHSDYSDRIKKAMWSNRYEIHETVQRNVREYAFEGWSARHVLEEDQMYLDTGSMTFIHPVHVVGFSY